jgi:ketosteroid isomerase-like protein
MEPMMQTSSKTVIDLEKKFWQSMLDQDTDAALSMLDEPALMVSGHGALKFDHAGYRKMAEEGSMTLTRFELHDIEVVFPNDTTAILTYRVSQDVAPRGSSKVATQEMADTSTWVRGGDGWRCVMHTETPLDRKASAARKPG